MQWPFDQGKNVAALTTRQIVKDKFPVLSVVHYSDDHSWAFTCGTTDKEQDLMLVGMGKLVELDDTLYEIADLPPGWCAERKFIGDAWTRYRDENM